MGRAAKVVNQSLRRLSWLTARVRLVLLKHHPRFAKSRDQRNSFDCVAPRDVRSECWVKDRHHVGSSHRILRLHERRHLHRPRGRRLSVAALAPSRPAAVLQPPRRHALASGHGAACAAPADTGHAGASWITSPGRQLPTLAGAGPGVTWVRPLSEAASRASSMDVN